MRTRTRRIRRSAVAGIAALAAVAVAPAGVAEAAVPGYQMIRFDTGAVVTAEPTHLLPGPCPAGKNVLGVGGRVEYGGSSSGSTMGNISLTGLAPEPIAAGEGLVAQAYRVDGGSDGNWGLSGYAVCSNPLPGLERRVFFSPTDSAPFHYKRLDASTARCSPGKKLLGAGAQILNAPGPHADGSVVLDDVTPAADLSGVNVTAVEVPAGTTANWTLTAWVVCADPLPGLQLAVSTSVDSSFWYKAASVRCPVGTKVLSAAGDLTGPNGIGGDITGAFGAGLMDEIDFGGVVFPDTVRAVTRKLGGDPIFQETWIPHAYAICAAV